MTFRRVRYLSCVVVTCGMLGACADSNKKSPTTRPLSMRERQEQALRDPYGYNPRADDIPSISGGDTGAFDKKSFKRDVDSFWNP